MNVLFMCVANSARSQIAEGLAKQMFPEATIHSAGSNPGVLNPFAVEVMKEVGIDISKHYSKFYDDLPPRFLVALEYIITLCAEEVCPTLVSKGIKLHWPHPDPASKEPIPREEALRHFREAREAIHSRLKQFKEELAK